MENSFIYEGAFFCYDESSLYIFNGEMGGLVPITTIKPIE